MISQETVEAFERAVRACDEARARLVEALDEAETSEGATSSLESVALALQEWTEAQRRFMGIVNRAEVPDPATASLLLKTNHGIDASNARCGIPGTSVDGADQPIDIDLTGRRGALITEAVSEYLS